MAMGISRDGIDFNSLDKNPVNYVFLLISSHEEPYVILQTMSTLIRVLVEDGYANRIIAENFTAEEIMAVLKKSVIREDDQILAVDLARPMIDFVNLDMSVEEASRKMHLEHIDVLAVLDNENKYCGKFLV